MPADPGPVAPPKHPMYALTTYELKDYRKQLERALNDRTIGSAPVAAQLRAKLDEVLREQESRQQIAHPDRKGPVGL
jgi:hypothetical protein